MTTVLDFIDEHSQQSEPTPQPTILKPFDNLQRILQENFYKPDIQAIRIVLGAIEAHRLDIGDPAWLFVVAPPGSGKTTMSIMGACGLPEVITMGDVTEKTFLSGFYAHQEPGILEKLGHTVQEGQTFTSKGNAILLAKDFTTVLSMRREKRSEILGQLREIHDGQFKRTFGTGVTKLWMGRVTIIAAVTPVLDRHHSIFSVLGERFLQVRWHRPDSEEAGEWAILQQGRESDLQTKLRGAINDILNNAAMKAPVLPGSIERHYRREPLRYRAYSPPQTTYCKSESGAGGADVQGR